MAGMNQPDIDVDCPAAHDGQCPFTHQGSAVPNPITLSLTEKLTSWASLAFCLACRYKETPYW